MRWRKAFLGLATFVVCGVAWYLFRPELLFVDRTVSEALPTTTSAQAAPSILARGHFHGVAHETSGLATIHQFADGRRVLRLTDFATSNGPDVRVYLIAAEDAHDSAAVEAADFIELGTLKGNKGDQNYEISADVELSQYRAVTIWCKRFSVNFGTAALATER